MKYDFDRIYDRQNTNAVSTDGFRPAILGDHKDAALPYADRDCIRMWIADMDFATPDFALEAVRERLKHPIFGYSQIFEPDFPQAFAGWCDKMYGYHFPRDIMHFAPGIVPALVDLARNICRPDEKLLLLTPSYGCFEKAASWNDLEYVYSDMIDREHNGYYEVDFEDFRKKAADPKVKLFILCNPHNPTGRVWSEEELRKMTDICFENDVLVISDEIHCDLLRSGLTHTPLARLYPDSDRIITCMAPSKTFNMAGFQFSTVFVPDQELGRRWDSRRDCCVNPLSLAAATAVFREGYDWLMELRAYLDDNFAFTKAYLQRHLPKAVFRVPEATYLAWVDIGAYVSPGTDIPRLLAEKGGVLLEAGKDFLHNADTCIRLNLACPRSVVGEGLFRLCRALNP